jgi:hypothetical protein
MLKYLFSCLISCLVFILALLAANRVVSQGYDISTEEIISHIRYLASDELEGRRAGTEGCEKAAKYIVSHFEKSGLKPLGDGGTYYQDLRFTSGVKLGKSNSLTVELKGKKLELQVGKDFLPLSFSSDGELMGDLVFAGYGISAPELNYDDYAGIDVKDKIVLVLRYTPEGYDPKSPFYNYATLRYKTMNARGKGARGIIFTTPISQREEKDLGGMRFDLSLADSGVHAAILKREIAKEILRFAGKDLKFLEERLSHKKNNSFVIPDVRIRLIIELIRERTSTSNVIGFLEGSHPALKDEVIIIGAHYDHIGLGKTVSRGLNKNSKDRIHNGADDNASGVAGLLTLAEYFSHHRSLLKRSLLFVAFSAEELGLLGSSHYIKNPKIPLDKTAAMINMDMIGRLRNNTLTVLGASSSPVWKALLESANSNIGLNLKTSDSGFAPSDQTVFYAKEIPVLLFFTGVHTDYHTPDDDWYKINGEGEKRVLMLISNLIRELNKTPMKIVFSRIKEEERQFSRFNVYLGTIPDYSEEVEGVKLMGVREGSPAEKTGLKEGDIIVEFGGKKIKNIYDYVYALGEAKAGVPTDMVVIRDGKRVMLSVMPERSSSNKN